MNKNNLFLTLILFSSFNTSYAADGEKDGLSTPHSQKIKKIEKEEKVKKLKERKKLKEEKIEKLKKEK